MSRERHFLLVWKQTSEPLQRTLRHMSMSPRSPRSEGSASRRRAWVPAVVAAVATLAAAVAVSSVVLDRREDAAAERLNAACQDNQSRAYGAAQRVNDASTPDPAAIEAARQYVKEVRQAPVCFADNVRADVEAVQQAVEAGDRPRPQYPKGIL